MGTELASLGWIERLIAIDTTRSISNLPLIKRVANELMVLGVPVTQGTRQT